MSEDELLTQLSRYLENKGYQFREQLAGYAETLLFRLRLDAAEYARELLREYEDNQGSD